MRTRFTDYKSYADAGLQDVFNEDELKDAGHLKATTFASSCFISTANGKYQQQVLPLTAQESPVYAMCICDMDGDQIKDIILGGNVSQARLRFGYCRANHGQILKGLGNGRFENVPAVKAGLKMNGDIRSICIFNRTILFGVNNGSLVSYGF
jgi:hypothetical protein